MDAGEQLRIWREELSGIGGTNPLSAFDLSSFGQVDLARSHPGGLAQLVSSRSTTLSNLVRDGVAQARAHSAVRRIKLKAERIQENFAIASCFIAAGLVEHRTTGQKMPILLWPTHLIGKGDDFEIRIDAKPILNPVLNELIRSSRRDFHAADLLAVAVGQGDLVPLSVLSLVSEILSQQDVEIEKLLVLGNFVPDLTLSQQAAIDQENPNLLQLLQTPAPEKAEPGKYFLVQDADSSQQKVIARAMSGDSFAVETLPGCGYLQTVVNTVANFASLSKRVLLVAPRKQSLDEFAERLSEAGLAGLAIRESNAWADAVAAISRNEKAHPAAFSDALDIKNQAEQAVANYFSTISLPDGELGVTLVDAIRELAALSALPSPPTNNARIRSDLLPQIRQTALEALTVAHDAKVFAYGPKDSTWYRARFANSQEMADALLAVRSIAGEEFRTLRYQINRYLQDQKLAECHSVEDWAKQLRLLIGIRETLDRFLPSIYDRSLSQLIAATAPRSERKELSGAQRRRFKKLAKEYIRPGSAIANLHQALVQAEQQRVDWLELNLTQAPPTVPLGLNDVQQKYEKVLNVLDLLQRHLDPDPDLELLTRLGFDELEAKVNDLATQTEILDQMLDRAPLLQSLGQMGLADLVHELCKINPSPERVTHEFELAWWQSALEALVNRNPKILDFSASQIAQLETEFERASAQLISQGTSQLQDQLANNWKRGIQRYPAEADRLRNLLRQRELNVRGAHSEASPLWELLAPAVLVSPYRLAQLSDKEKFDVVIVLDAASSGMAETLPAMLRASQVIAFGDPALAGVEGFDTVARANQGHTESLRTSVFDFVSERFGAEVINHSYRTEGQVLGRYLNENFYRGKLVLEPAAGQLFGSHNFEHVEIRDGAVAASTIEGATESLDAEVQKVIELVLNHARWTPEQSLNVITASQSHAERIAAGVERELQSQHQLAEFFEAHGRERFQVVTMSQFTHRLADRIIFSIGFGRTPEGRISGSLGDFNSSQAARWMVNTIVSARKRLTVVSCYNFEDFAAGKLPDNQMWLKDLIAPSFLSDIHEGQPDPLLLDLSLRLQKLGFKVALNFGDRIGLAVSLGQKAAVIDPDWALKGDSWDEKLRLRPGLLRSMGWQYIRVHALEIFAQPQDVANRIAKLMGLDLERKAQPLFDEKAFEDTNKAWGDPDDDNDDRLRNERPPHWG
ncbi:MAG: hypothetical protein RL068_598 [Actinomycetota bacterium]